ncbi:hypothetical protein KQI89_06110 [Clostridium sp. MSJ-4]|uniref:Uncharacterized protein n=1 Tax=Clostridium simiarum TaxID=2841506 RepID=A0ABS6EYN8_9CLOT|nr:hypothetical protein [Clostridium simiarum]MBU5591330.1 hypothetical protein [Clostridium simiarum]
MRDNLKSYGEFLELPRLKGEEIKKLKEIFRNLAKILYSDLSKDLDEKSWSCGLKLKKLMKIMI